jgi:hypothetical protein
MTVMSHQRTIRTAVLISTLGVLVSCSHRAPESRVRSLEARIDGITCPTCVPPLTASLKRQYAKSTIEVDDDKDTATIHFAEHDDFSAQEFQGAVERVLRMRVVAIRLQACGTVETSQGAQWMTAGGNRFLVRSDRELPLNNPICADGALDGRGVPAIYQVSAFSLQNGSGS